MKHAEIFTRLAQRADPNIPILEAAMDEIASLQAKIDRLMLEYCPDEMTPEQVGEWGNHQVPASAPVAWEYISLVSGGSMLSNQPPDRLIEPERFKIVPLYTTPQPCPRCAELSESLNNRAREQAQKTVKHEVSLDKFATLEAELSGLRARYLRMESEDAATIAQQAEQLAAAESRLHDVATHCATVEQQLAAAEKDAERYRWLRSNHPIQELPVGTKLYRLPEGD